MSMSVSGAGPQGSSLARDSKNQAQRLARPAAHILRLQLTAFRSWQGADLRAETGPVVITGPNGSGKTNILEAISMLAPGRGLLGAKIGDLTREPSNSAGGWAVSADLGGVRGDWRLGAGAQKDAAGRDRRVFRLNGEPASSNEMGDLVRLLWLTPAMDRLFLESAGTRRRFFDRMIVSLDPSHGPRVARYEQAMAERSRLLKDGSGEPAWLSGLERTMAEEGTALAATRREFCSALSSAAASAPGGVDTALFPQARLSLECAISAALDNEPAVNVEGWLADELARMRPRDAAAGRALTGPHRADWSVMHVAKGRAAAGCSGGEQKALLITLILAQLTLVADNWGQAPLLLLDEIGAQLDSVRRDALFEALLGLGVQAWMTGTDEAVFDALKPHATFIDTSQGGALAPAHLF